MKNKRERETNLKKVGKTIAVVRVIWWIIGVAVGILLIGALIAAFKAVGTELTDFFKLR